MTLSTNAKLRLSNCVIVTHLNTYNRCDLSALRIRHPLPSDRLVDTLCLATAKSVVRRENLNKQRRISAAMSYGRFLFACMIRHGGCAWANFGSAGSLCCQILTLRTAVTLSREKEGDGSINKGVTPMANHAVNTPRASARYYLFRVVHPATNTSTTVIANTPTQALEAYGAWFSVPTSQLAINRRSPVKEVRS